MQGFRSTGKFSYNRISGRSGFIGLSGSYRDEAILIAFSILYDPRLASNGSQF